RDQLACLLVNVDAQFLLELIFHLPSAQKTLPPIHSAPPSDSFRTSPTASIQRCQLAVSVSSCIRPFLVSRSIFASLPLSASSQSAARRPRFPSLCNAG